MNELEVWAAKRLKQRGWSNEGDGRPFSLTAAIIEYQAFHGLPATGEVDEATEESLGRLRFCGHPDQMVMEARVAPLPVKWRWVGSLPTVPDDQVRVEIQKAWDRWARVAPLPAREAEDGEQPNTIITATQIDGRNGVLADMYLPGPMPQHGRIDTSEIYTIAVPIPAGKISLGGVMCHEFGHRHGLSHLQAPGCLMNAYYNPDLIAPQPGDIQAIGKLYPGGPSLPPAPPPVPPTGTKVTLDIFDPRHLDIYVNGVKQKVGNG